MGSFWKMMSRILTTLILFDLKCFMKTSVGEILENSGWKVRYIYVYFYHEI